MPAYISLIKFTPQGLAHVKESPQRLQQARAVIEQMGGRVIGQWLTMGEYDLISITEGPDDETAARVLLLLGLQGNVTTQTLRAFSEEEFARIVSGLP